MFKQKLTALCDENYKGFSLKLIPNLSPDAILGVRMPLLRAFAKTVCAEQKVQFMRQLPHKYHEENLLHALFICQTKDVDQLFYEIEEFLPHVDNWAVCDAITPKLFAKHQEKTWQMVQKWIKSGKEYAVRLAFVTLLHVFVDDNFSPKVLDLATSVDDDRYYVKMAQAWFFAECLAKQFERTIACFTEQKLNGWTHNKSLQKACESFRLTSEQKAYIKTLKV